MNKKLLLVLIISVMAKSWLAAQVDTIPDLIISEQRMDWGNTAYIELTNMEDTALDLSQFIIESPWSSNNKFYFAPNTMLAPKESYVLCNTREETENNWPQLKKIADQLVYVEEPGFPGDSIGVGEYILQTWNGKYASILWYKSSEVDSMIIDCFNWNRGDGTQNIKMDQDIAGVTLPVANHTLIRKLSVTEGNLGDWEYSRGTSASESEWLLAKFPTYNQVIPFATVGNHGEDYPIVATSANSDLVIDMDNGTITVPWGIYRGDSIIRELNIGDGMAWTFMEKAVFEDSVHNVIQTGDSLQLKSFGETMQVKDFLITVSPPASDMNLAFPTKNVGLINPDDPASGVEIKGTRYYVTDGMPTIDTIGDVPFAARVDTLFNYIEWASNADAEIIWKDGSERVDLMNGDILEVTAEDGSKKQYYIDVQDYSMNDNVNLSAITWPDITNEDILYDLNWITDTVPGFLPSKVVYTINLRYGSKVPAIKAYAQDLNAKISYEPAVSLKGGLDDRTTVITVTSESDTLTKKYSVIFVVEILDENRQKFFADPLFTGFVQKAWVDGQMLEIANPGTEPLDLSQYLITAGSNEDALTTLTKTLDSAHRYNMYVPGYRLADEGSAWNGAEYRKLVSFDADVNPIIAPGDVFLIGQGDIGKIGEKSGMLTEPEDFEITFPYFDEDPNVWGLGFNNDEALGGRNASIVFYLWKIDNPEIFDGTKAVGDPDDVTLIDAFGLPDGNWYEVAGYAGAVNQKAGNALRKPSIYKPNPSYVLSASDNPEDSEWILLDPKVVNVADDIIAEFGSQSFDPPVTAYISTVSSLVYIVDDGYQGDLGITGISYGETIQQFYDNLIIADTAMDLRVKNSTDGAPRDLADPVAQGDTLVVISADGETTTKYELDLTPLDDNTNLVPSDGSELTVADGAVSGFDQGTSLESVLAGVKTASDLSILYIMNPDGELVPLQELDSDGEYQLVLASSDIMFEVIAQNGDKAQYQLTPNSGVGDAFVLSSIYEVDNDYFIISGIPEGTAVSGFMANIIPAEGATVKIVDKLDYDRTLGGLAYDDLLVVVSNDGSKTVTYMLNFMEEIIINTQPSVSVPSDNIEVEVDVATSVSVTAEDDGLPAPPGALSYTWSVSSGEAANVSIANPDQATTDITFSALGSYVLQVVVDDGELESVATVNVSVVVGIETFNSAFKMYPNPASEKVILEFMDMGSRIPVVSIYNITGKTVYIGTAESRTKIIDVSSMDNGLYIIEINTGVETITKKLSIIK